MTGDWRTSEERSTSFMLRLIIWLAINLRRALVRPILYPTVFYFLLTSPSSRAASFNYLRRVLLRKPTWRDHWRHFFAFASCTLDRIFLLGRKASQLSVDAVWSPDIRAVLDRSPGCLLLAAHFGSREVLRLTPPPPATSDTIEGLVRVTNAIRPDSNPLPTAILMDRSQGRMITELFDNLDPQLAITVIDATERGPQLVLKLKEAVQQGRMVCITADRVASGEGSVPVQFLGGDAHFAEGPWILAGALRVPVILGFGIYRGGNRYESHFELFAESVVLPRQNRGAAIENYAQRYALRLEHYARLAPYNWFNFYDFWPAADPHRTSRAH